MTNEAALVLRDTTVEELARIHELEQGEARNFILPHTSQRHRQELAKPDVVYKSIYLDDRFIGFVILVLDPDGRSVEFRRIVVSRSGRGYGTRAIAMVTEFCRQELGRCRVWLDVFSTNRRARHVYEKCGYRRFGSAEHEGRTLLLYESEACRDADA